MSQQNLWPGLALAGTQR